jgi:uncharacterized protein (DUF4415 family)
MRGAPKTEAQIRAAAAEYARGYNPNDEQSIRAFLARAFVTHSRAEMQAKLAVRKAAKALLPARARGERGPQKVPTKVAVALRLDRDIVERLRASGEGWQTRVNDLLRAAISAAK